VTPRATDPAALLVATEHVRHALMAFATPEVTLAAERYWHMEPLELVWRLATVWQELDNLPEGLRDQTDANARESLTSRWGGNGNLTTDAARPLLR
jgi:hypothetical protein